MVPAFCVVILAGMPVRVLIVALAVQLVLAGLLIWAAMSDFSFLGL